MLVGLNESSLAGPVGCLLVIFMITYVVSWLVNRLLFVCYVGLFLWLIRGRLFGTSEHFGVLHSGFQFLKPLRTISIHECRQKLY